MLGICYSLVVNKVNVLCLYISIFFFCEVFIVGVCVKRFYREKIIYLEKIFLFLINFIVIIVILDCIILNYFILF